MPKSLKPPSGNQPAVVPASTSSQNSPVSPETPRRNVLTGVLAILVGGLVSLAPLGTGLLVFLDPILKRKASGSGGQGGQGGRPYLRVASLDMLPSDGTPVQVPVIADLTDAWNREPNQPVGAVYLRRVQAGDKDSVECFNAICPHAGCFVAFSGERKLFQCPCHTSSFQLNGDRILPSPSPRNMDALKVDEAKLKDGEVWVQFVNYYPGHEHREEKP